MPRFAEPEPDEPPRRPAEPLAEAEPGHPLSRRARQRERSLESHIAGQILPRHMERLREIEDEIVAQRVRAERAYRALEQECGADAETFERRWRALASRWRFDDVNELIDQHNEWYPVEAALPLDPRTGDYVTIGGRDYRRRRLDAAWLLERFPARRPARGPRPQRARAAQNSSRSRVEPPTRA